MASVSQSEFGSQSALTRELPTALDLAETSALGSALQRRIRLVLVVHLLVASDQAKASSPGQFIIVNSCHRYVTAYYRGRRNRPS